MAKDTRNALLDAADRVVTQTGVNNLTLEKVAAEAGVSKGGLLYHFPNKDALITGMIERLMHDFSEAIAALMAADPDPDGRWLRAFINATFTPEFAQVERSAGLLAAASTDTALLDPFRVQFAAWQDRAAAASDDPAVGTLIRLAADGLWFAELLGISPLDDATRESVRQTLITLTRQ